MKVAQSCPTPCDPMDCSPWNSPGQNTRVDSLSLLQGIFPTQGSDPGLPHCRRILYQLSHKGSNKHRMPCEKLAKGILSTCFWCLCHKLSLSLWYLNKTHYTKSSEWSSLVSGPKSNSSPLEVMNPSIAHGLQQQPFTNTLKGNGIQLQEFYKYIPPRKKKKKSYNLKP